MTDTDLDETSVLGGYGEFRSEWIALISPFVVGQHVCVLGCGGRFSRSYLERTDHEIGLLLSMGARKVTAIEKDFDGVIRRDDLSFGAYAISDQIDLIQALYVQAALPQGVSTIFTKWPANYRLRWGHLLMPAKTIIYVGLNDGITACGDREFWLQMQHREVKLDVRGIRSNLTVYGNVTGNPGVRPEEEQTAIKSLYFHTQENK
jgi:hypothetical protein